MDDNAIEAIINASDGTARMINKFCNASLVIGNSQEASYNIVLGDYSSGSFLCIPDSNLGCALAHWSDTFWNTERISMILNKTDAVMIATGIYDYWLS